MAKKQYHKCLFINNLFNRLFIKGIIPVAVEVVFFYSDGFEFSVTDLDSFFVWRVIHGTKV